MKRDENSCEFIAALVVRPALMMRSQSEFRELNTLGYFAHFQKTATRGRIQNQDYYSKVFTELKQGIRFGN